MGISRNLAKAMELRDMTQDALEARCGMGTGGLSPYLKADCDPDPATLRSLAEALKVDVSDFYNENGIEFTSFGTEFKTLRESLGLSRNELAQLLEVRSNRIAKWELDMSKPNSELKEKLVDLLGSGYTKIVNKYVTPKVSKPKVATTQTKKGTSGSTTLMSPPRTSEEEAKGKAIGKAVKAARKEMGLTSAYVASNLEISTSSLQRLEAGYIPKGKLCDRLKRTLGVDVDKVIVERQKREPFGVSTTTPIGHKPEPVTITVKTEHFKPEWVELLGYIEDDHQFRLAATQLFKLVFEGKELKPLADAPEANMVIKMIAKKGA